jgi:hypothetical protein
MLLVGQYSSNTIFTTIGHIALTMRTILFLGALCLCLILEAARVFAAPASSSKYIPGTSVEMPYLIAPITIDGKLVSYAYVSSRIVAVSTAAAFDVREKTPFIQDAYVRDVNHNPVSDGSDPPQIDTDKLIKRLLADARQIVGGDKVSEVQLIRIQISPIRPDASR